MLRPPELPLTVKSANQRGCSERASWQGGGRERTVAVEAQVRHQFAQLRVLVAQLLGFLRLNHVHPPVLDLGFQSVSQSSEHEFFGSLNVELC